MSPKQLQHLAMTVADATDDTDAALLACWTRLFRVHLSAVEAQHGVSMEALHDITRSSALAYAAENDISVSEFTAALEALERAESLLGHPRTTSH
jgi:hypothetical protein